jgi:pseudaminic acid synthase
MMTLSELKIGREFHPFIVAEISGNHNQSLERALKIVEEAAKSGCHGLKIQTYTADTMTIDIDKGNFLIDDKDSLWVNKSLYQLYKEACTPWEWHEQIFNKCKELGIIGFSTPFDTSAVDFLENLGVQLFKIASFEIVDLPLIKRVAETRNPIIMSTGMASIEEIAEAVDTIRSTGNNQIVLLKCTSTYPSSPQDSNITTIPHLKDLFNTEVGLSDHTLGIGVAIASVALGCSIIEKHFTLSRADGGVDSAFSMEPDEMRLLVQESKKAYHSLGHIHYGPTETEKKNLKFRRSLYVVQNLKQGELITGQNVRSIRPADGLLPKYLHIVLGRKAKFDIKRGTPLSWDLIE